MWQFYCDINLLDIFQAIITQLSTLIYVGGPIGLREHRNGLFLLLSRGGKREYGQNLAGKTATGTGIWVKSVREKRENGKITVHLRETGEKNTGQNFFYKLKTPKQKIYIQNGSGKSHAPHFGAFAADIFLIPPLLNLNT